MIKIKLIFVFVLILCKFTLFAYVNKKSSIGIQLGINWNRFSKDVFYYDEYHPGLNAGIFGDIKLNNYLSTMCEIYYMLKVIDGGCLWTYTNNFNQIGIGQIEDGKYDYINQVLTINSKLQYLNIPLILKCKITKKLEFTPYLFLGPCNNILLFQKATITSAYSGFKRISGKLHVDRNIFKKDSSSTNLGAYNYSLSIQTGFGFEHKKNNFEFKISFGVLDSFEDNNAKEIIMCFVYRRAVIKI